MLIDSNVIIYAAQPQHVSLRQFIAQHVPAVSAVSYVEVLGFHRLTSTEKQYLEAFFAAAEVLPLTRAILDEAVRLRQHRKMTLGDSLIAATCLVHRRTLVTHNTADFTWVPELTVVDPLAGTSAGSNSPTP